ncbi:hypothetical protein [Pseudomarimonas salicorniae]|uniref:Uncharacterized protein n=1 Tax=Pseudomarimonas salicorniae TaxID=2933270 RepID=A0ABT0GIU4_9GAMM|nr:hypothetical protein [Lysobacter sp. CAU 1642]MCK7594343.1 hypothetical protein [Lysobacter sp. CAU 1642]
MSPLSRPALAVLSVLIAAFCSGAAKAECAQPPSQKDWLVKVEHLSTYPVGAEWNTRLTVHDAGCLVVEAPATLRIGGGRTEWEIPAAHLDGLRAVVEEGGLHSLKADSIAIEMKRAGETDLGRLGADHVTDAPVTVVRFRNPQSGQVSEPIRVEALHALTLPKAMMTLGTVQDIVRIVDQLGLAATRPLHGQPADQIEGR